MGIEIQKLSVNVCGRKVVVEGPNIPSSNQSYTIYDVKNMLLLLPKALTDHAYKIKISLSLDPLNKKYAERSGIKDFSSFMTFNRITSEIVLWANNQGKSLFVLKKMLAHELAHSYDNDHYSSHEDYFSLSETWHTAMRNDEEVMRCGKYCCDYATSWRKYSIEHSIFEDFACSFEMYIGNTFEFRKSFPYRAGVLEKLINDNR